MPLGPEPLGKVAARAEGLLPARELPGPSTSMGVQREEGVSESLMADRNFSLLRGSTLLQ